MNATAFASRVPLAAVVSGVLYFASFPPWDFGALAWVALVPLFAQLGHASRRQAIGAGWIVGTVGCTALVATSIYAACRSYFDLSPFLSGVVSVAIPQVYGAPYFMLFAGLAHGLMRRYRHPFAVLLGLPAAYVAAELARAHIGHGAPWVMLGHSQHAWPMLIQCADLAGVYGVSFLVALVNATILVSREAIVRRRPRSHLAWAVVTTTVVAGAALLYGRVQLTRWSAPPPSLRVALVQGSTPEAWRYALRHVPDTLKRYRELTQQVAGDHPDLIIWPENAVSVLVSANPDILKAVAETLPASSRLLLGAPRAATRAADAHETLRNAAFFIDDRGAILGIQDKLRLTPFAEYAPRFAPGFLDPPTFGTGRYAPGDERTLFSIGAARFAVLICYEAIYPDLARERVLEGAQFLVNISNDDWFDRRPAIHQHLIAALFRAVETRRYLLRATSSGVTAVIDPRGVVVASAPVGEATTLTARVSPIDILTFHARYGDVFAWICVVAVLAMLCAPRTRAE